MNFNPSKRTSVRVCDIERARFWYDVRLYLKVIAIMSLPTALALWALMEWLG